jgi:hypothetical protein
VEGRAVFHDTSSASERCHQLAFGGDKFTDYTFPRMGYVETLSTLVIQHQEMFRFRIDSREEAEPRTPKIISLLEKE